MRVLLVEDNTELVSLLIKGLAQGGFSANSVGTVGDAAHVLATMKYAAIVLDLGLPDEDGLTLLRDMRRRGDSTPVLVLTARDGVTDRVTGLREGADDYLAKPFAMEELVARLQALLRRPGNLLGRLLTFGNVSLDTEGRQVFVDGAAARLPGARDGGARDPAAAQRQRGAQAPVRGSPVRSVGRCRLERRRGLCPSPAQDAGGCRRHGEDPYGARRRLSDGRGKGRVRRFRSIITRIVALHVVAIGVTSILMPLALYWLLNQAANNLHRDALRSQAFTIASFLRPAARRRRDARHPARGAAALFRRLRPLRLCRARHRRAACCSPRATTARRCSRSTSSRVRDWFIRRAQQRRGAVRRQRARGRSASACTGSRSARTWRIATSSSTTSSPSFFPRVAWITFPILLLLLLIDILIFRRALDPVREASTTAAAIGPQRTDVRLPEQAMPAEIAPLVHAVNQALDRLEAGFRAQRDFTADMAHELRTPLAIVRARVDSLEPGPVRDALRADLVNMTRTVNQVLDIAELESFIVGDRRQGRPPCGLRRRRGLHGAACRRAVGKTIALTGAAGPVWVRGHAEALFRAVRNLVENAIRHTPAGVSIEVEVTEDGIVRVLDDGPGVPEADRESIFRRFWRRDRSSRPTAAAWAWPSWPASPRRMTAASRSRTGRAAAPSSPCSLRPAASLTAAN